MAADCTNAPNAILTAITGINNSGAIVGFYDDSSGNQHGFALAKNKFYSLDYPRSGYTAATRINDTGEIVGYYGPTGQGPFSGFTESGGTYSPVNFPASLDTRVRGVNEGETIVGRYTDLSNAVHGFMGMP